MRVTLVEIAAKLARIQELLKIEIEVGSLTAEQTQELKDLESMAVEIVPAPESE